MLFRVDNQGTMTQVEIAKAMHRDKTTITRRIDSLIKKEITMRTLKHISNALMTCKAQ